MYDTIIEIGIGFLLIYTPLAFGGVTEGSVAIMELVTGLLLLVWLAKVFILRHPPEHSRKKRKQQQRIYHIHVNTPSFFLPMGLFIVLLVIQLVPLPAGLIKFFSPAAYRMYAATAFQTGSVLPAFLPFTVCSQATEMELYKMMCYAAIFLLTINNIRSPHQIRRILMLIVAVGLVESFYGLFEYFSGRDQIFFYKKTSSFVSGTFINKNHFAGYMEMVIPLTFGVLFARLKERSQLSSRKLVRLIDEKYMKALLVGFFLSIMIGSMLLSGSRGGLVSFVCGMISLIVLAYNRHLLRKWAVVVLVLVMVSVSLAMMLGRELFMTRIETFTHLEREQSFHYRSALWKDSFQIFRDFPLIGTGLGTFAHIFPQYQTTTSEFTFTHAENDYLQLLVESGILGSVIVLFTGGIFFVTTLKAWKKRQSRWSIILTVSGISSMLSIVIHSCIDFNLHIPSNALLFSVVAALSYVAAHSRRRSVS